MSCTLYYHTWLQCHVLYIIIPGSNVMYFILSSSTPITFATVCLISDIDADLSLPMTELKSAAIVNFIFTDPVDAGMFITATVTVDSVKRKVIHKRERNPKRGINNELSRDTDSNFGNKIQNEDK